MNRRDAVQYISLLLGGTIVGGNVFLSGCKTNTPTSMTFTEADISLLDEIADTILPPTKTPGAKAAKVGQFMTVMVNDCYEAKDQKIFHEGMGKLNEASKNKNGKIFIESTPSSEQKHVMEMQKNKDGKDQKIEKMRENPNYYFRMMKELTMLGYFTSEIGCTQARRYIEAPGKYDGNLPYKKGDKAFA